MQSLQTTNFETFMSLSKAEQLNYYSDTPNKYFTNTVPTSSKMQLFHLFVPAS